MPRRRLPPNIDNQVLDAAIRIGAAYSMDKVTTLKVAQACGINEATVYRHFVGKEQLLEKAFEKIDLSLRQSMDGKRPDGNPGDPDDSSMKQAWLAVFCYLVDHPEETLYYGRYLHSRFFRTGKTRWEDRPLGLQQYIRGGGTGEDSEKEKRNGFLRMFVLETMLHYAEIIASGEMENTPAIRETIYQLICHGVVPFFDQGQMGQ